MSSSDYQNRLSLSKENGPIHDLIHTSLRGKWIRDIDLEAFTVKKYQKKGMGITFADLMIKFNCSKVKAQRRLKNACMEKRDKNGKKSPILFTLDKRAKPQKYYPSCMKAKVIEDLRKKQNKLIGTTGVTSNNHAFSSKNPLDNALIHQSVSSFLSQLSLLPFYPLLMHNIHLWTIIERSHYLELLQKASLYENKTKIVRERIGLRQVIYHFHKKGSIELIIESSRYPFKIETDDDINSFFVFLGQVKDRLGAILCDPRERIVPDVNAWILKSCDFNKDIEFEGDIGQLLDLNIQMKNAGKAFRLYVKNLENRFVFRAEKVMKVDQPITTFLNESILNPYHLLQTKIEEMLDKKMKEFIHKMEEIQKLGNNSIG